MHITICRVANHLTVHRLFQKLQKCIIMSKEPHVEKCVLYFDLRSVILRDDPVSLGSLYPPPLKERLKKHQ